MPEYRRATRPGCHLQVETIMIMIRIVVVIVVVVVVVGGGLTDSNVIL
jgi:hypothetical protein